MGSSSVLFQKCIDDLVRQIEDIEKQLDKNGEYTDPNTGKILNRKKAEKLEFDLNNKILKYEGYPFSERPSKFFLTRMFKSVTRGLKYIFSKRYREAVKNAYEIESPYDSVANTYRNTPDITEHDENSKDEEKGNKREDEIKEKKEEKTTSPLTPEQIAIRDKETQKYQKEFGDDILKCMDDKMTLTEERKIFNEQIENIDKDITNIKNKDNITNIMNRLCASEYIGMSAKTNPEKIPRNTYILQREMELKTRILPPFDGEQALAYIVEKNPGIIKMLEPKEVKRTVAIVYLEQLVSKSISKEIDNKDINEQDYIKTRREIVEKAIKENPALASALNEKESLARPNTKEGDKQNPRIERTDLYVKILDYSIEDKKELYKEMFTENYQTAYKASRVLDLTHEVATEATVEVIREYTPDKMQQIYAECNQDYNPANSFLAITIENHCGQSLDVSNPEFNTKHAIEVLSDEYDRASQGEIDLIYSNYLNRNPAITKTLIEELKEVQQEYPEKATYCINRLEESLDIRSHQNINFNNIFEEQDKDSEIDESALENFFNKGKDVVQTAYKIDMGEIADPFQDEVEFNVDTFSHTYDEER